MKLTLEIGNIRAVVEDGVPSIEVFDWNEQDFVPEFGGDDAVKALRTLLAFIEQHAAKG